MFRGQDSIQLVARQHSGIIRSVLALYVMMQATVDQTINRVSIRIASASLDRYVQYCVALVDKLRPDGEVRDTYLDTDRRKRRTGFIDFGFFI